MSVPQTLEVTKLCIKDLQATVWMLATLR